MSSLLSTFITFLYFIQFVVGAFNTSLAAGCFVTFGQPWDPDSPPDTSMEAYFEVFFDIRRGKLHQIVSSLIEKGRVRKFDRHRVISESVVEDIWTITLSSDPTNNQLELQMNAKGHLVGTYDGVSVTYIRSSQSLVNCPPPPCRSMFVSSSTTKGDFQDVSALDKLCQSDAESSDLPWVKAAVDRGDRWLAMVTTSSQQALARLTLRANYDCTQRVDGALLIDSVGQLVSKQVYNQPYSKLDLNRYTGNMWTGGDGAHCRNWTTTNALGGVGSASSVDTWAYYALKSCANDYHFYCINDFASDPSTMTTTTTMTPASVSIVSGSIPVPTPSMLSPVPATTTSTSQTTRTSTKTLSSSSSSSSPASFLTPPHATPINTPPTSTKSSTSSASSTSSTPVDIDSSSTQSLQQSTKSSPSTIHTTIHTLSSSTVTTSTLTHSNTLNAFDNQSTSNSSSPLTLILIIVGVIVLVIVIAVLLTVYFLKKKPTQTASSTSTSPPTHDPNNIYGVAPPAVQQAYGETSFALLE